MAMSQCTTVMSRGRGKTGMKNMTTSTSVVTTRMTTRPASTASALFMRLLESRGALEPDDEPDRGDVELFGAGAIVLTDFADLLVLEAHRVDLVEVERRAHCVHELDGIALGAAEACVLPIYARGDLALGVCEQNATPREELELVVDRQDADRGEHGAADIERKLHARGHEAVAGVELALGHRREFAVLRETEFRG